MAWWGAAFTSAEGRSRNLLRENQEVRPRLTNCPPNCPPRAVFLVLTLKFYTQIFVL